MTVGQKWRVVRRFVAMNFANAAAYRIGVVMWMMSSIITPIIGLAIWRATASSGADLPVSTTYLTTYFVLSSLFSLATSAWHGSFIPVMIREGSLSVALMRPGSIFLETVANNLAEKAFKLIVLLPMVCAFGWFFREDIAIPGNPGRWLMAVFSLLLGAVMFFSLRTLMGTIGFWWEETRAIENGMNLVEGILLGGIIPLALFPAWSQGFMSTQPFRFRFAFALDLLLRDMSASEIVKGFAWQVLWTGSMLLASIWLWDRGRRAYSAVGG